MSVTLCPGLEFQLCDIFSQSNLKPKNNSDTQELSNYFKNNNEVLKNVQRILTRATSENISEILEEGINFYFPEYQEESSIEMKSKFIPAEFQSKNPKNVFLVSTLFPSQNAFLTLQLDERKQAAPICARCA